MIFIHHHLLKGYLFKYFENWQKKMIKLMNSYSSSRFFLVRIVLINACVLLRYS
ncbi:hypothetical protein MtrunA17_Chr7g0253001 [Medicago truncatula]|uniref:Uncharacterized protein n=1 Tax=Medicago truncatula TaxID=3880 RepID=A0A396H3R9_MEDTR|nr:hypothetical protein MtrunA17_Chr7g0253001 [Medicago truncatula]